LKPKRLRLMLKDLPVDDSHPRFAYDPNKCVLCGKCVWVCREKKQKGALNFAYRGFDMTVTTFGQMARQDDACTTCTECIDICPVGALLPKEAQESSRQ
jgi:formate dehydrogenase major subunit/NADH-quinone oxidoreductase subunit G